jgi:hypothetical protein
MTADPVSDSFRHVLREPTSPACFTGFAPISRPVAAGLLPPNLWL